MLIILKKQVKKFIENCVKEYTFDEAINMLKKIDIKKFRTLKHSLSIQPQKWMK